MMLARLGGQVARGGAAVRGLAVAAGQSALPASPIKLYHRELDMDSSVLADGKSVVVGVPGAFTQVCSQTHIPGFLRKTGELKAKGVDRVLVVSVNDAHVMDAWERVLRSTVENEDQIPVHFVGDGNAEFSKHLGMDIDLSAVGFGLRCKRFAMVVDNGKVASLDVEASPADHDVSSADNILTKL